MQVIMVSFSNAKPETVSADEFSALDVPHPYGVKPNGNRFFGEGGSTISRREEIFTDDLWQLILSFCDGKTMGKVVQVSHYLYAAGHQPELWRDLMLRHCDRHRTTIDKVGQSSWKDAFATMALSKAGKSETFKPHSPIAVSGVYSDVLYRSHLCRSFHIPKLWLEQQRRSPSSSSSSMDDPQQVQRRAVDEITPKEFFEDFEKQNIPVIIEGAAKSDAVYKWSHPDYMRDQQSSAEQSFRTTSGAAPLPGNFTLKAYQDYSKFEYHEEAPLYLFDRTAFQKTPQWERDFFDEFYKKCPFWDPSKTEHGHDLFQHLGAHKRPDHTWLIMGPKRSGSVFHIDPNCTHAWNASIVGAKKWIFYPPGVNPPGVYPSADGDEVAVPLSVGEWITQYWEEHCHRLRHDPPAQRPLECTVAAGDVIFVPHGFWHMVINLDEVNIAITHNYVSRSNLGNVLRFLTTKQDQISGCRDRAETIKPEFLHDAFVDALRDVEPEALAVAQQQSSWTCAAWKDISEIIKEKEPRNGIMNKKKRPRSCGEDSGTPSSDTAQRSSVMAKTEKIEAFTFSFL